VICCCQHVNVHVKQALLVYPVPVLETYDYSKLNNLNEYKVFYVLSIVILNLAWMKFTNKIVLGFCSSNASLLCSNL